MNTWIVVCDSSRARLFSANGKKGAWSLVRTLEHPESRMMDSELAGREQGRQQQSGGFGRPAMEPVTQAKEVEREAFATELGHLLDHEFDVNSYADLVLVAPPHFLGLLRKRLGGKLMKRVIAGLDKDYTLLPLQDLQPRVEEWLRDLPASAGQHAGR